MGMMLRRRVYGGGGNPFIQFADPAVKAICVANWGGATGGSTHVAGTDGEMTYEQAAAVTSISTKFLRQNITSFDELQFFTALTSIQTYAFYHDSFDASVLQSIILPDSITSINTSSFVSTGLQSIIIPDSVISMGDAVFLGCKNLVSVKFSMALTIVPNQTFDNNSSLEYVTLPITITSVGDRAFCNCIKLKRIFDNDEDGTINIPDGVTSIGSSAFSGLNMINSIVVPSSVVSIGGACFAHGISFQSVVVNAITPPTLGGSYCFYNTNNCPIYVPDGSITDYKSANLWSSYASRIKGISEMPIS